jgi:hypothetical protein
MSTSEKILLGFEVAVYDDKGKLVNLDTVGKPVFVGLHHLAIFGMTQLSGKTTALEALISRSGLKAIAFKTKRGERGFTKFNLVTPYYKPRADWQFVEGLVNVALGEKVKYEPGMRYAIMKVCRGHKDLREIRQAAVDFAKESPREFMKSVYEKLAAYLDIVVPELEKQRFSEQLELQEGVNVMDLSSMRLETQHLVIASTIEYAFSYLDHVVVIVPEAWETLPQSKMTPVKWVAQQFIRKGAAIGNYLWLDSQDIGGIDKTPLRQCDNWLMGRMKEAHEVERILKQLLGLKVPKEEIQTLALGQFYAAIGNVVKKVYVLPVGVPEDVGARVARGELTPEYVRDLYLRPVSRVLEGDINLDFKQAWEQEKTEKETLKAEIETKYVPIERFKDACNANAPLLEERDKLKDQCTKATILLSELKDKLAAFENFEDALVGLLLPRFAELVKTLKDNTTSIPAAMPGPDSVVISESIPTIHHKVERPIVETDESSYEGRIITLVYHDFFKEKRRANAIIEEIHRVFAVQSNAKLLNEALGSVVQKKVLQREQSPNGGWEYWLVDGAKERIKEVEAK